MSLPLQLQHAARPPAQPAYILRAHSAHVHAVRFLRHNSRLLTGDADGWVVLWDVATKRAAAVWRAHDGAILGFGTWAEDKIITHGRDFHLRVWQLRPADENGLSTALPVDGTAPHHKQPWLLHSVQVNTLNFCSFATCPEQPTSADASTPSILVAVPGTKDGEVHVFQLPSERHLSTVPVIPQKTGMTMSIALMHHPHPSGPLHCISAYESGATAVHAFNSATNTWAAVYTSHPHTQPILSLCPAPPSSPSAALTFFTSAADDLVAKHIVVPAPPPPPPDSPASSSTTTTTKQPSQSLLSAAFASSPTPSPSSPPPQANPAAPAPPAVAPAKATHTKHAGQQSLALRSDGRLLATAGWDGRARVYSATTLKEVAVLAWHREGCYAVGFADVGGGGGPGGGAGGEGGGRGEGEGLAEEQKEEGGEGGGGLVVRGGKKKAAAAAAAAKTVRARREDRARAVHWLAAGSKDGKVSLWEVF